MSRTTTALVVGLLVLVAAIASGGVALAFTDSSGEPAQLSNQQTAQSNTITVSASGTAEAEPDQAILRVAVEETDPSATEARSRVAEKVTAVREALIDMGLDESQITTTGYNIYLDDRRSPEPTDEPDEPEYRVRHTLQIEIDDTSQVGQVIDAAVDAGVTNVYGVQFTLSDETREQLHNDALTDAMASAQTQADTIASSAALSIDGVHSVQTGYQPSPIAYQGAVMAADSASTDISPGPVTVSATVTVTYSLTQ